MANKFLLPQKVPEYLNYLAKLYQDQKEELLCKVLKSASIRIKEGTNYDNLDGGCDGHSIHLFIPESLLIQIDRDDLREAFSRKISKSINKFFNSIGNEFIDSVHFDILSSSDSKKAIKINQRNGYKEYEANHIWQKGYIKLFITHRDVYKKNVSRLSHELKKHGVSCFVAHDNIEPMREWQKEIETGLFTMDALLVYLTDDISESDWIDQETGVAIGREVPIIPLKMQKKNPYGLISKYQAIKWRNSQDGIKENAKFIFEKLVKKLPAQIIEDAIIERFTTVSSFSQTSFVLKNLFPIIQVLDQSKIQNIINAFEKNNQIHDSTIAIDFLPNFLYQKTGEKYHIKDNKLHKDNEDICLF